MTRLEDAEERGFGPADMAPDHPYRGPALTYLNTHDTARDLEATA